MKNVTDIDEYRSTKTLEKMDETYSKIQESVNKAIIDPEFAKNNMAAFEEIFNILVDLDKDIEQIRNKNKEEQDTNKGE